MWPTASKTTGQRLYRKKFSNVLQEAENFYGKLRDFEQTFSNINQVAGQFTNVKDEIEKSVVKAQDEVEELKTSSLQVEDHFGEMESTFADFQTALNRIAMGIQNPHQL